MGDAEGVEAADVLDRMANPHPRMWTEARTAYMLKEAPVYDAEWRGFLRAMCAATGYDEAYFLDKLAAEVGW